MLRQPILRERIQTKVIDVLGGLCWEGVDIVQTYRCSWHLTQDRITCAARCNVFKPVLRPKEIKKVSSYCLYEILCCPLKVHISIVLLATTSPAPYVPMTWYIISFYEGIVLYVVAEVFLPPKHWWDTWAAATNTIVQPSVNYKARLLCISLQLYTCCTLQRY